MALIKQKEFKGNIYQYWGIISYGINKAANSTNVTLGLFKDQATREADINNYIDYIDFRYMGNLTEAQCFPLIKQSNIINGVENNFFADATDLI